MIHLCKNNFEKLENFCNDIVSKYPNLIFDADDFTSLPESALVSLLKRDDLQMKEVKIWDYVIKWEISQNPALPTNFDEWSKENFLTLKTTLQQSFPYFHQLFYQQFSPRAEEPKELFSIIISEDHAAEISIWIDRKTSTYTNNPYRFELIVRGSRVGFAPQTFWDIFQGHANTILVVKVKGADEILGSYNPFAWDNSNIDVYQWTRTEDSFIFSLKNGNIQNSILSRVKNTSTQTAVVNKAKNMYGPQFGLDFYVF
ncbi:hypothetical protein Glove_117g56 [Diversispora epigaea]|uniref:TLDc domain-containing protein n=1 Tax=Diversispora epigaea TaxID=1348612 RepID=A0A397IZW4_9GLOM|nr:hypothetical protein Glove_117g56 [Diversispora epigaea]